MREERLMGIETEVELRASELAVVLDVALDEARNAITAAAVRHPPAKRNVVSVLSSTAWLIAMLNAAAGTSARQVLTAESEDGRPWRQIAVDGGIDRVAAVVAEHLAGPADVAWDGNWPNARPRLRGAIPADSRPGDMLVGGDGGGTRIHLEVVEEPDGVLSATEVVGTWRDPPLEEAFTETYERLAQLYPEEIPPELRPQA